MYSLLGARRKIRDYNLRLEKLLANNNEEITPEAIAFSQVLEMAIGKYQLRNLSSVKIK